MKHKRFKTTKEENAYILKLAKEKQTAEIRTQEHPTLHALTLSCKYTPYFLIKIKEGLKPFILIKQMLLEEGVKLHLVTNKAEYRSITAQQLVNLDRRIELEINELVLKKCPFLKKIKPESMIEKIDLRNLGLTRIPSIIFDFKVRILLLDNNKIIVLPMILKRFQTCLEILSVSYNRISQLESYWELRKFTKLTTLHLAGNTELVTPLCLFDFLPPSLSTFTIPLEWANRINRNDVPETYSTFTSTNVCTYSCETKQNK